MAKISIIKLLTVSALIPGFLAVTIGNDDPTKNQGLLGDLISLPSSELTTPGTLLGAWLQHIGSALAPSTRGARPPTPCDPTDVCCPWWAVADDLTALFIDNSTGECTDDARGAVRLGFHDSASYSKAADMAGQPTSGADGSFLLFREDSRPENNGLQNITGKLATVLANHPAVGAADLIQFAAQHAIVTCPQGPRIRFFAGRKDANQSAPPGLVPDVHSDVPTLVNLMMDKTINAADLTALLGAHTSARQFDFDNTTSGEPIDTTPGIWDTNFYNETLQANASAGVTRFPSDFELSRSQNMSLIWQGFVDAQGAWNFNFALAYTRIGLLGVDVINNLTECTDPLPLAVPQFAGAVGGFKKRSVRHVRFH